MLPKLIKFLINLDGLGFLNGQIPSNMFFNYSVAS